MNGDIQTQIREGKFDEAVKNYDQVLQNFPTGNKAPSAQLKKGFALLNWLLPGCSLRQKTSFL